jgi:ABC-2 type transport system ATP-binding protein
MEQKTILKITNLNKHYGKLHIIKNASLSVKKGGIYGFIGQNGSGKTTIIRLITGLALPDKVGAIELYGETNDTGLNKARGKVDGVIENPAFYPNFNAKQNLIMKCIFLGLNTYHQRVTELLELVKLSNTGKKKVKNFSLGMKQRLAIATSLISDPDFLILDEPTNGLDPAGIKEIRELMLKLAKGGITILVSSHLLAELKLLVDNYIVIRDGKIIDEFKAIDLDGRLTKELIIEAKPIAKAIKVLKELKLKAIESKDGIIRMSPPKNVANINKALVEAGIAVSKFALKNKDTEGYFMNLMGGGNNA